MKRAAKDLWYGHFGLLSFPNLEYGFSVCACVKVAIRHALCVTLKGGAMYQVVA